MSGLNNAPISSHSLREKAFCDQSHLDVVLRQLANRAVQELCAQVRTGTQASVTQLRDTDLQIPLPGRFVEVVGDEFDADMFDTDNGFGTRQIAESMDRIFGTKKFDFETMEERKRKSLYAVRPSVGTGRDHETFPAMQFAKIEMPTTLEGALRGIQCLTDRVPEGVKITWRKRGEKGNLIEPIPYHPIALPTSEKIIEIPEMLGQQTLEGMMEKMHAAIMSLSASNS